jgi:hypothetical protein
MAGGIDALIDRATERSRRRLEDAVKSGRIGISEAAELLGFAIHTLRSWDRSENFPADLRPERDPRGRRYWTREGLLKLERYLRRNGRTEEQ